MATEYRDKLDTLGLTLTEIHQILDIVLGQSYFTFNQRLYIQLQGLFMGCSTSPICAIVRMYMFEKRSIYMDVYYLNNPIIQLFYGRYFDDVGSLAKSLEESEAVTQLFFFFFFRSLTGLIS